ncbi:hypothetical protein ACFP3Q_03435 [Nocardioides sp. GCM10027113]|uniref:hypothetical protein n=1 Tax=unclassified Nocardioides TaxID=2615069 RepID=UPI00360746C8
MSRPVHVRSVAAAAVLGLTAWGTAAPALAEPGNGKGKGHAHGHAKQGERKQQDKQENRRKQQGKSENRGQQGKPENPGQQAPASGKGKGKGEHGGGAGDPAGNNGTVKVAPYGEMDGIPQNSPHPGCEFQVEWYGFDEGEDVVSTVSFAMQAPTRDVDLSVSGPTEVWVGEDPASGAGTETGLDGTETYTLSFDGEPHAQQGYHVKLTVATPRSLGNDTKSKVFSVEPCETDSSITTASRERTGDSTDDTAGETVEEETQDGQVLGVRASTGDVSDEKAAAAEGAAEGAADVPTAVDAGEDANPVVELVASPWGALGVVALGAALVGGVAARRRSSVQG